MTISEAAIDLTHVNNWIAGEWRDSPDRRTSIDPATGQEIGTWAYAQESDVTDAIEAAARAFATTQWRHDRQLRARVLNRLADLVEQHREELVALLSLDNGKVRPEAEFEIGMVPPKLRYWAGMALVEQGRASQPREGRLSLVVREPMGVAGIIVPFNSPVILAVRSLAPALAAGTTTVIKFPADAAQISGLFTRIVAEIDELPRGVVNAFVADRLGASALVESPDVPVISFTGSTATGRAISAQAARRLKRLGLELGGKTPVILFPSADVAAAVPVLEKALTTFAGQFCMTGSRLLVHSSIAAQVRDELASRLRAVQVGPATDPASDMGPLITRANVERVDAIVQRAIAAGAEVIVRGGPATEGQLADGSFYRPTFLGVQDPDSSIMQEETFGPVLTITNFETEDEAIAIANNSDYGLAASVWSRDVEQPLRVARALEAGTVWINDWALVYDEFEEGGYKQSGQGRLNGLGALDDFCEYKHIAMKA